MKHFPFFILIACFFLMACPSRKTSIEDGDTTTTQPADFEPTTECATTAIVRDFTGVDGCRILFELGNGDKLLPNEMPILDFKLENNQAVNLDYDVVKDAVSACMMESQIVRVTCINVIGMTGGVKKAKSPCVKADSFSESKWLKHIAGDMNPYIVTRYKYNTDGCAYLLDDGMQKKLYDCQGTLMCSVSGKALNECNKQISSLGEGTMIHATKPPRK